MPINEWWADNPDERFWMEITDRTNLGANLLAPTTAKGGKETFSYTLVDHVKEGDVVYHWWSRNDPAAIVATSTVSGPPFRSRIRWAAHGTYSAGERTTAAFEAPLDDFVELESAITLTDLRSIERRLRQIRDDLQADVNGPIYFPWAFSDKRPMRTTQGYLVKLPAAVVYELGLVEDKIAERRSSGRTSSTRSRNLGVGGRQQNQDLKRATEQYAVRVAAAHFEELGYEVHDVGATRSYDLHAVDSKGNEVHVEVKGSTTHAVAVELTEGEVQHWDDSYERALVVVDEIESSGLGPDYEMSGGRIRIWRDWNIDHSDGRLMPTRYRYTLIDD